MATDDSDFKCFYDIWLQDVATDRYALTYFDRWNTDQRFQALLQRSTATHILRDFITMEHCYQKGNSEAMFRHRLDSIQ
jgi:hypothetical protein